jgi:hypothetical protein
MPGRRSTRFERVVALLSIIVTAAGVAMFFLARGKSEFQTEWGDLNWGPSLPLVLLVLSLPGWWASRTAEGSRRYVWLLAVLASIASVFWDTYAMLFYVAFPAPLTQALHHGVAFCEDLAAMFLLAAFPLLLVAASLSAIAAIRRSARAPTAIGPRPPAPDPTSTKDPP